MKNLSCANAKNDELKQYCCSYWVSQVNQIFHVHFILVSHMLKSKFGSPCHIFLMYLYSGETHFAAQTSKFGNKNMFQLSAPSVSCLLSFLIHITKTEKPKPLRIYPAAKSQNIIRDDKAIVIQLKNAKATEIWYLRHSCPNLQLATSAMYSIVTPAEAEAAARDSVAVTCKKK